MTTASMGVTEKHSTLLDGVDQTSDYECGEKGDVMDTVNISPQLAMQRAKYEIERMVKKLCARSSEHVILSLYNSIMDLDLTPSLPGLRLAAVPR